MTIGRVNGPPETGGPFVEVRLRAVWVGVSSWPGVSGRPGRQRPSRVSAPAGPCRLAQEVLGHDLMGDGVLADVAVPGHAGCVLADATAGNLAVRNEDFLGTREVGRLGRGRR